MSRWVRVDGRELHYRASVGPPRRAGVPVVLVHGLASSRYMRPLAEHLAPEFAVYVPDLPGFGRSWKPQRVLSLAALADALAGWLDAVGQTRADFFGNSMGCNILVEFAIRHARRVRRLVLQGLTLEPSRRTALGTLSRWAANGAQEPMGGDLIRDYMEAGLPRMLNGFRAILRHPLEDRLPLVAAPTLLLRGSHDLVVSAAWTRQAAGLMRDAAVREIPGAAHTMNRTHPLETSRVMKGFLR